MKKINEREILRAAEAGDTEVIEEIISRSEIPERKRPHDREFRKETRGKRRNKTNKVNPSMEMPVSVLIEENIIAEKEEPEVKTAKIQEKENKPQAPSPFITALIAARKVNTREPREEQPKEMEALKKAMDLLNEDGKRSIVFRLVNEVLEDKTSLQCLFPAARIAGMSSTAHSVAAIRRAIREGGLTFSDLTESGLAEIRKNNENHPYTVYRVGHDAIVKAEEVLRKAGKKQAAECLAVHIRRGERNRALAEAGKETAAVNQP